MLAFDNAFWVNDASFRIPDTIVYPDLGDLFIVKAGSDGRDLEIGGEERVFHTHQAEICLQRCVIFRVHELIS